MGDVADADNVRRWNRKARVVRGKNEEQVLQVVLLEGYKSLETSKPTKRLRLEA